MQILGDDVVADRVLHGRTCVDESESLTWTRRRNSRREDADGFQRQVSGSAGFPCLLP